MALYELSDDMMVVIVKYSDNTFGENRLTTTITQSEKNKYREQLNWANLSQNPNAIHIIEQHLDNVNWGCLSQNPNAIHLLEKNLDKVNWGWLSSNPNAIHLLE